MMAERFPVLTAIKELLDDQAGLRRRFKACARTRRSTCAEEVAHWRGVLKSETGEEPSAKEVGAALGALTTALMPNSPAVEELAGASGGSSVGARPSVSAPEMQPALGDAAPDGTPARGDERTDESVEPAPVEPPTPLPPRPAPEEYPEVEYPDGGHPEDGQPDASPAGASEKIGIAEESENARNALRALVEADPDAAAVYEKQCEQGLVGIETRAKKLGLELEARGEFHKRGALEAAITELAVEKHPESAAAAWEGLLARRLRDGRVARLEKPSSGTRAVAPVVDFAAEEWCFKLLTHLALDTDGPEEGALLHASREVYAALRRRGRRVRPAGFSEHIWGALREVLPDAPGVRWSDAWAGDLARRALAYVSERDPAYPDAGDSDEIERAHAEVVAADEAEDRRRYRRALREWVEACLRASEKGG